MSIAAAGPGLGGFGPVEPFAGSPRLRRAGSRRRGSGVRRATGVAPAEGGRHLGRGTRNALVGFGETSYLEIIGPDPDQPADPGASAPFGLGTPGPPRLVTWAVRPPDLDAAAAASRPRAPTSAPSGRCRVAHPRVRCCSGGSPRRTPHRCTASPRSSSTGAPPAPGPGTAPGGAAGPARNPSRPGHGGGRAGGAARPARRRTGPTPGSPPCSTPHAVRSSSAEPACGAVAALPPAGLPNQRG